MISKSDESLLSQIEKLITESMEKHIAIKGISIGTALATNIITKLKPDLEHYSESELVAASTSFQYIAKNLFENLAKNNLKMTYVTVEDRILMLLLVKEIAVTMILDRLFAELEGLDTYKKELNDLSLKIAAFVETSDYLSEDPFLLIKRAIPSALILAIITREGMPIKIEGTDVQEALVGSMVAALSNLTHILLHKNLDYTYLQGIDNIILVVQFDEKRILALMIPSSEENKIGTHLARIKEIIKKCNLAGSCF